MEKQENKVIKIEEIKEAKSIASLSKKVNNIHLSASELVKEIQERPLSKKEKKRLEAIFFLDMPENQTAL